MTIANQERHWESRRGTGPLSLALLLCLLAVSVSSKALAAVFSQQITLPTPPTSQFATSGGGDGWNVALSSSQVFNVFHHNTVLTVACHNQSDASQCWPTLTRTVSDGVSQFQTPGHAGVIYDATTNKLYVYALRTASQQAGVVCVDPVLAATSANPFCGFTPLTGANEGASVGWSLLSLPMRVGNKLYSFNYYPNLPGGGASGTTSQNKLLCYDISTGAACAAQPYAVNLGAAGIMTTSSPSPGTSVIGNQIIIPTQISGQNRLSCYDTSTGGLCAGAWPISVPVSTVSFGPMIPVLDATSAPKGFCVAGTLSLCYTLQGTQTPPPPSITSIITPTVVWQGAPVTLGPRVYVANGNTNQVQCYDYSTSTGCPGFPKTFSNLSLLYTVNTDPARPTCLWVNSDNGAKQIQNFDAYTGGACNGIRVLAAQFIVPQDKCNPTTYRSLKMLAPAPGAYTSATISFNNGAGNPLGIPDKLLDGTGTIDLTGLPLNTATGLPQFVITLAGASATLGQVTLELTWESNYDPSCVGPGGQVTKEATTITTSLTDGKSSSTTLSVDAGTSVTDTSTITGANAATASGSLTYTWYSDNACTVVASAGSAQPITTPGTMPASAAVTLGAGTYYSVVSYSGDAGNNPSSSHCGDEVLQVNGVAQAPSCALTSVIAGPPKQLQITVQGGSAGIATIDVTDSTNASVDVPAFSSGETDALVVVASKVDQSAGSHVALRITDVNGLVTDCDPDVPGEVPSSDPTVGSSQGCSIGRSTSSVGFEGLVGLLVGLALVRRRRAKR